MAALATAEGESVTLAPAFPYVPAFQRTSPRVCAARLLADGWVRADLCSRVKRSPSAFADVNVVILFVMGLLLLLLLLLELTSR